MDPSFNHNSQAAMPQDVLPASQYLQERLQERRLRNVRPQRTRQSDFGPMRQGRDDDIFLEQADEGRHATARGYDSSPVTAHSAHRSAARGSVSSSRRSLGVRDVDTQLDQMSKQNFALKLELDHRREHTVKLQGRVDAMQSQIERAEALEEEHAELLRINSQLVEELEKRDKAVEEAMDIICDLEEKVVDLEEQRSSSRPTTANADSGYASTETHEQVPPSSPLETISKPPKTFTSRSQQPLAAASAATNAVHNITTIGSTPSRLRREPSFLSHAVPNTHALRSVYLESAQALHSVKSFQSIVSKRDSRLADHDGAQDAVLDSPRLSVLSESSFPSLYSPRKPKGSPERHAWEANETVKPARVAHPRQDSINRVSRWISDSDSADDSPAHSVRTASPLAQRSEQVATAAAPQASQVQRADDGHYQSLNDALSVKLTAPAATLELLQPVAYARPRGTKVESSPTPGYLPPNNINGPKLNSPMLPPTPDSATTLMLRASRSSLAVGSRSLLDTAPAQILESYDALEPGLRTAPKQMRSSIELNTAYFNSTHYQQQPDPRFAGNSRDDGSSSSPSEADDDDARSVTVKDHSMDYDGFPDGNSIIMGTPSRFLRHGQPTVFPNMFDGNDISPPPASLHPQPRRRKSSSSAGTALLSPSSRKPSLGRSETSPSFLGTLGRMVTSSSRSTVESLGASSQPTFTSPRSAHSGSSAGQRSLSPEVTRSARSVSRSLSQRTQKLFRRMSTSQREESPAPAPAKGAAGRKEMRRPSTTEAAVRSSPYLVQQQQRPPSSGGGRERPAMQTRTRTEPAIARPGSAATIDAVERRGTFLRRDSGVRPGGESAAAAEQGERGGIMRRRGSVRDAVAGRRPWR